MRCKHHGRRAAKGLCPTPPHTKKAQTGLVPACVSELRKCPTDVGQAKWPLIHVVRLRPAKLQILPDECKARLAENAARNLILTLSPQIYTTAMGRHRSAGVPAVFQGGRREKPGSSRARPGCKTDAGTTGTKKAGTRHACRPGPVTAQRRPQDASQPVLRPAAALGL